MKEIDKLRKIQAIKALQQKEEDARIQQQLLLKKKNHILAELVEELDEIIQEEKLEALLAEDDERQAQVEKEQLAREEIVLAEKLKTPSWINIEKLQAAVVTLEEFDATSFDEEEFLETLKNMDGIKSVNSDKGKYTILLHNNKFLELNLKERQIHLNDFSDESVQHLAKITQACGCYQLNFSAVFQQKDHLNMHEKTLEHACKILQHHGLDVTVPENVATESSRNLSPR